MSTADTSEIEWSQVELDDAYEWTDSVSANGKPFKIGVPKHSSSSSNVVPKHHHDAISDDCLSAKSNDDKPPFDINVNWTVYGSYDEDKQPTEEETRITAITHYRIYPQIITAGLRIRTTKAYKYYFYDETNDRYPLNVFWPRPWDYHILNFFSSKPNIVRVTGS